VFENIIKSTQVYKDLVEFNNAKEEQFNNEIELLRNELEELKTKSSTSVITEGSSTIMFEIDNELSVTVKSSINKEIISTLIDNKYLDSSQSEDDAVIQLVFVLLANEATEQIMEKVNQDAN